MSYYIVVQKRKCTDVNISGVTSNIYEHQLGAKELLLLLWEFVMMKFFHIECILSIGEDRSCYFI